MIIHVEFVESIPEKLVWEDDIVQSYQIFLSGIHRGKFYKKFLQTKFISIFLIVQNKCFKKVQDM